MAVSQVDLHGGLRRGPRRALLGPDAPGLSAATIGRLKAAWQQEHARWERRSLKGREYVYLWVDVLERSAAHGEDPRMRLAEQYPVDGVQAFEERRTALAEVAWQ